MNTLSTSIHKALISFGDEIVYSDNNFSSRTLLDIHSLRKSNSVSNGRGIAFSKNYFVVCPYRYAHNKNFQLEIYDRQNKSVYKLTQLKAGLTISGKDTNATYNFAMQSTDELQLFDNILLFRVQTMDHYEDYMGCLRLDTGYCDFFPVKNWYNAQVIAATDDSVYLKNFEHSTDTYLVMDLLTGNLETVMTSKKIYSSKQGTLLRISSKYLVCCERNCWDSGDRFTFSAIELATHKVKKLPYTLIENPYTLCRKRLLQTSGFVLLDSMFYCFFADGTNCKFDLTEESPKLVELHP